MSQSNPYFQTYLQQMVKVKDIQSKQHLFSLSINLAHVHNLLGLMISDIIKFMGTLPFDHINARTLNNEPSQCFNNQHKATHQHCQLYPNQRLTKDSPLPNYVPQKKEQKPKQPIIKNPPITQTEFERVDINLQKPRKQDFYNEFFLTTNKKQSESLKKKSQRKRSNDSQSSKTQTVQIVRSNQEEKKLTFKNSYYQLSQHHVNTDKAYKVNSIKKQQQGKNIQNNKNPFFDLFDDSQKPNQDQGYSNYQNFDIDIDKPFPQTHFDVDIDKPFPQTQQVNYDSYNPCTKISINRYSPQMKKQQIIENPKKNVFQKSTNLLNITHWNNSEETNLQQFKEGIDQIESSKNKPFNQRTGNRKNISKAQSANVEYIPRREENGRKKSERQGLQSSQCPDCRAFYDAVSQDGKKFKDICQCTSRHKSSTTFMGKHKVQNFSQDFRIN